MDSGMKENHKEITCDPSGLPLQLKNKAHTCSLKEDLLHMYLLHFYGHEMTRLHTPSPGVSGWF